MPRTISRLVGATLAAAALGSTLACSAIGADNTEACDNIKKEVRSFTAESVKNVGDTKALSQSYHDLADKVRSEGEKGDGDLQDATSDLGDAYDKLGDTVANLENNPDPTAIDQQAVTEAGTKFEKACE